MAHSNGALPMAKGVSQPRAVGLGPSPIAAMGPAGKVWADPFLLRPWCAYSVHAPFVPFIFMPFQGPIEPDYDDSAWDKRNVPHDC